MVSLTKLMLRCAALLSPLVLYPLLQQVVIVHVTNEIGRNGSVANSSFAEAFTESRSYVSNSSEKLREIANFMRNRNRFQNSDAVYFRTGVHMKNNVQFKVDKKRLDDYHLSHMDMTEMLAIKTFCSVCTQLYFNSITEKLELLPQCREDLHGNESKQTNLVEIDCLGYEEDSETPVQLHDMTFDSKDIYWQVKYEFSYEEFENMKFREKASSNANYTAYNALYKLSYNHNATLDRYDVEVQHLGRTELATSAMFLQRNSIHGVELFKKNGDYDFFGNESSHFYSSKVLPSYLRQKSCYHLSPLAFSILHYVAFVCSSGFL